MKRILHLILALVLILSLCACGNDSAAQTQADAQDSEDALLQIGDTAQGTVGSVTVTSVEFVDKIENGYLLNMWSPAVKQTYEDVTAEDGYSIVKISYHFDYTGKESGDLMLNFTLNYDDGYTFEGIDNHAVPVIDDTVKVGFEEKYVLGGQQYFTISDPLEFQGTDTFTYIFVNNAVKENPNKSYVLEVGIPAAPSVMIADAFGMPVTPDETPEVETFVYNLR